MTDNPQQQDSTSPQEPSVLDYVKSLFRFGKGERIQLPEFDERSAVSDEQLAVSVQAEESQSPIIEPSDQVQGKSSNLQPVTTPFPWRSLLAFLFALIGQNTFEPPPTTSPLGFAFYIAAFAMLGWAIHLNEWNLEPLKPTSQGNDPLTYRRLALLISVPLLLASFILFKNNLFTITNVVIWCSGVFLFIWAFWVSGSNDTASKKANYFKFNCQSKKQKRLC